MPSKVDMIFDVKIMLLAAIITFLFINIDPQVLGLKGLTSQWACSIPLARNQYTKKIAIWKELD